ncbi:MAG: Glycerol-3-phosphate dehydrogenase 1 [Chlamydiia bacterium]|nr:Glycerol-3-phosphate dehydrogenase 1 [Chlamydiia bacterium]
MAKGVVNATGIFTDSIRKFDNPSEKKLLALSRGSHLIIDKKFFPGKMALIDPKTEDGRVFFIIPWLDSVIIGTTDEFTPAPRYDSHPREREIRFLLKHANKHLAGKVQPSDIKALYSGIRPLVKLESKRNSTAKISRRHSLTRSKSNLITVTGGKWGIFRKMGEEAVDMAIDTFDLEKRKSRSKNLTIPPKPDRLEEEKFLHPDLAYTKSDIEYAVQEQMAVTLEDVLARRTRCLFLNHQATMAIAPSVCQMMAEMMGKNEHWVKDQLMQFTQVAESYKV